MSHSNVNPDLVPTFETGDPSFAPPTTSPTGQVNYTGMDSEGNIIDPIAAGQIATSATVDLDAAVNLELDNLARIQNRANQIHNVWAESYLPCELATLAQVDAVAKETVNIAVQGATGINAITQAYASVTSNAAEVMSEICFTDVCGPGGRIQMAQSRAQSWHAQANLRYEEVRVQEANAQRLNDRMLMISPGRSGATQAINALQAAGHIFSSTANQAEASKGGNAYAAGRILEFAKNNLGALAKLAATPDAPSYVQNPTTDSSSPTMYGPEVPAPQVDYQYDTGAELYGVDPVTPTYTAPTFDIPIDGY